MPLFEDVGRVKSKRGEPQWAAPEFSHESRATLAALLTVRRTPAPSARAEATGHHAFAVDAGHDVAVTREKRFGRAHLGTDRQFALCDTVAAVFGELGCGVVFLRATGAEGTFVHLAA